MIFASDLDRTLIFSSKFIDGFDVDELVCVEYKDEKPISYMLKSAIKKLVALESNRGIIFVPTTTRSVNQFKRIHVFENVEYAITSNGGTILHNGEPLKEWEDKIQNEISEDVKLFDTIIEMVNLKNFVTEPCLEVDNKFLFFKTDDKDSCREWLNSMLDNNKWSFTIQGNKVYILPKCITKENAIKFLSDKLGVSEIICSGDGKLDEGMLKLADKCLIPSGSGIFKCSDIESLNPIIVSEGLNATGEILDYILSFKKA